ncbi:hypothetical protein [Neorhizobium sp. DT-125]|uniref:hypothetical protein n=1 Tax=Neorhizobium sp. DT-125 TaxID=3396163 RepID=UPI003F1A855A
MSRFAALLMVFAWLLYGAMPVVAMPLAPAAVERSETVAQDHAPHHGKHDHGKPAETAKAAHVHGDAQQPCPHGAKSCIAPFCAACLTLLPDIAISGEDRFAHGYPAPAIDQALVPPATAPLTPPPRA